MKKLMKTRGFSLVEILVSLLVVSLAAVNVSGLQKMVAEQNRNNVAHTAVIELATEKMEDLLENVDIDDVDDLNGKTGKETSPGLGLTTFNYKWGVAELGGEVGEYIRDVELQITWNDAKGDLQTFTYSEQVNLNTELKGGDEWDKQAINIIVSLLETNDVIYFEPKMGYKKGSFVIYNSQLYEATSVHSVGNGHPRDVADPNEDTGWKNYGRIDNPDLASNLDLATLFID